MDENILGKRLVNRIDKRSPHPESLKEFYDFVFRTCPHANHSESEFLNFIIKTLKRDPIKNSGRRTKIEEVGLNFALDNRFPLNDYWSAADKYLESLGVGILEINKFDMIMNDGFR